MGGLAFQRKNWQTAGEFYRKLIRQFPNHELVPQAKYQLGMSELSARKLPEAWQTFNELARSGGTAELAERSKIGLARVALDQQEFDKTLGFLDDVLANATGDIAAEAQFYRGKALASKGDLENAAVEYLKVKYLYPDAVNWVQKATFQAGKVYERAGRKSEALRIFRALAKTAPDKNYRKLARREIRKIK
ncbi:outer membrane protein assembly factor BamD [bacterium BMS3Abin05]|nr:outer membrane protein assembly factor BamD [bacterium BMS3Abin05]